MIQTCHKNNLHKLVDKGYEGSKFERVLCVSVMYLISIFIISCPGRLI